MPLLMGTTQPALAESSACAGQTEPRDRHGVPGQHVLRRVDAPSPDGSHGLEYIQEGRGRSYPTEDRDALVHKWLNRTQYAFPLVALVSLCPVQALRVYNEHSTQFRQSEQLFVCFRGHPVRKQRLSHWIVDAIAIAYASMGLQCPTGLKAHSTRGMASPWAWSSGVSIGIICAPTDWPSPSTFARF